MPEVFQDNQIASGHDNVAGLVNIETILVDGDYFITVKDLGNWRPGAPVLYGDGLGGRQGIASTTWVSGHITLAQYAYVYTTLLGHSQSNFVTVRTRQYVASTYANYNAVLTIPSPDEIDLDGAVYTNFVWQFTKMTLIP